MISPIALAVESMRLPVTVVIFEHAKAFHFSCQQYLEQVWRIQEHQLAPILSSDGMSMWAAAGKKGPCIGT